MAGVKWGGKRLHPSTLDQNESTFCDPPHIYTSAELIFSRLTVEKTSKLTTVSVTMIAFVLENSKLIMIFLLVGLIIALGRGRTGMKRANDWRGPLAQKGPSKKKRPRRSGAKFF